MEVLVIVILIGILFFAYIINQFDIFSVSSIYISMFLLSLAIVVINYNYWNETISFKSALILSLGIILFVIGDLFSTIYFKMNYKKRKGSLNPLLTRNVTHEKLLIYFFIFISLLVQVLYFSYIRELAIISGFGTSGRSLLFYARQSILNNSIYYPPGWLLKFGKSFVKGFAFIMIYLVSYRYFFNKKKIKLLYIVPIFIYLIQSIFSTGRTELIYLFVYTFLITVFHMKISKKWSVKSNIKTIVNGILLVVVFLVLFRFLGYLTGKSDYLGLWDNISIYLGSSIIAFGIYIENGSLNNVYFGEETLGGIYSALNFIGLNFPRLYVPLESISWLNVRTNVYTSLRRYINDYGLFGLILIQFILGLGYGYNFNKFKYSRNTHIRLILFAKLFFPVVEAVIEERFFNIIFTTGMLYDLVILVLIHHIFLIKQKGVLYEENSRICSN